jgi:hypothetical protein
MTNTFPPQMAILILNFRSQLILTDAYNIFCYYDVLQMTLQISHKVESKVATVTGLEAHKVMRC